MNENREFGRPHINPGEEDTYWRQHHENQPWRQTGSYDDYRAAYRTGYEGYAKNCGTGRGFDECEADLRRDYERTHGGKLSWDKARYASRAAWEKFDRRLDRYIDFDVLDRDLEKIGTLQCLWSDQTGEPAFVGVKTGWFFGKTHVVPAQEVQVNEVQRHLKLPYSVQQVKDAPSYNEDAEMTAEKEREVYNYYGMSGGAGTSPMTGSDTHLTDRDERSAEGKTLELSEEQLKIGKREVETGGVRLRKVVRTKVVNQPVETRREEVVIERVPANEARATTGQGAFREQEIYIPLRREEVVVEKETRVREEVRARKQVHSDQQQVSEKVRSEDVEIEEKGEARRNSRAGSGLSPAEEMRHREELPRSKRGPAK